MAIMWPHLGLLAEAGAERGLLWGQFFPESSAESRRKLFSFISPTSPFLNPNSEKGDGRASLLNSAPLSPSWFPWRPHQWVLALPDWQAGPPSLHSRSAGSESSVLTDMLEKYSKEFSAIFSHANSVTSKVFVWLHKPFLCTRHISWVFFPSTFLLHHTQCTTPQTDVLIKGLLPY